MLAAHFICFHPEWWHTYETSALLSFTLCFLLTASSLLQAVNELLESLGAPLEIVDGFVSSIAVTIPWQALLTDHCTLEVSGLQITCRPKYRTSKFAEQLLESSCGLISSSDSKLASVCHRLTEGDPLGFIRSTHAVSVWQEASKVMIIVKTNLSLFLLMFSSNCSWCRAFVM